MKPPYPSILKITVLQQVISDGRRVTDVSRELNVGRSTIYRWLRAEANNKERSKEKFIIKKLEQKLKLVSDERDILIKAASILARKIDSK